VKDRPDFVPGRHKLCKHAIVDRARLRVRLEDAIELDHLWDLFQLDQPETLDASNPIPITLLLRGSA
jgi:hypothetical protein